MRIRPASETVGQRCPQRAANGLGFTSPRHLFSLPNRHASARWDSAALPVLIVVWFCVLAAPLCAQQPAVEEPRVRFRAVDIYIDSTNAPLAAYQLEFTVTNGVAKIVGIEGGESPVFREPPFYDPKAMQHERVILAAFSTEPAEKLPSGKTRVATIHLQVSGTAPLAIEIKLVVAADSNGNKIGAGASVEERKSQ